MKNRHAVALGKRGGRVGGKATTPAKIRAARANGKKGGRPKGTTRYPEVRETVRVIDKALGKHANALEPRS